MVRLTPAQLRRAEAMLAGNATLGAIAKALGLPFEAVVLGVYGGGAAWVPPGTQPQTAVSSAGPGEEPASDGGAVSAVKGSVRLENAVGVEPPPSTLQPQDPAAGCDRQPASAPERRYRLRDETGAYLHRSGRGMTRALANAWTGTNAQLEEVLRRVPHLKDLDVEPAPMKKGD